MKKIIRWFKSLYGVGKHRAFWANALASGQYKQGHGHLRKDDQWCCLAVACEVFRLHTGEGEWSRRAGGTMEFHVGGYESGAVLPFPVANWYGYGIEVNPRVGDHQATHWNDYVRLPFAGMARLIRGEELVVHNVWDDPVAPFSGSVKL